MTLRQMLRLPMPASPGRRKVERTSLEGLSDEERCAVLDALEWSDLDSSKDLVGRTDAAIEHLGAGQASRMAHHGGAVMDVGQS